MGNDTSKATGTDFQSNQATRDVDNAAEDLPTIPYLKQKKVNEELILILRESNFLANYKRAFRGYLRKKPETNQTGTLYRIHTNSLRDGELLGLAKDTYAEVIDKCVIKMSPDLSGEVIEFLLERKKLKPSDDDGKKLALADKNLAIIFRTMTDGFIEGIGKKLYEKYSRGADFEGSDAEVDREKLAKLQAQKEERLKKAAEERQRQAEQWMQEAAAEEEAQAKRMALVAAREAEQKKITEASML
jgi:hypothetical protein